MDSLYQHPDSEHIRSKFTIKYGQILTSMNFIKNDVSHLSERLSTLQQYVDDLPKMLDFDMQRKDQRIAELQSQCDQLSRKIFVNERSKANNENLPHDEVKWRLTRFDANPRNTSNDREFNQGVERRRSPSWEKRYSYNKRPAPDTAYTKRFSNKYRRMSEKSFSYSSTEKPPFKRFTKEEGEISDRDDYSKRVEFTNDKPIVTDTNMFHVWAPMENQRNMIEEKGITEKYPMSQKHEDEQKIDHYTSKIMKAPITKEKMETDVIDLTELKKDQSTVTEAKPFSVLEFVRNQAKRWEEKKIIEKNSAINEPKEESKINHQPSKTTKTAKTQNKKEKVEKERVEKEKTEKEKVEKEKREKEKTDNEKMEKEKTDKEKMEKEKVEKERIVKEKEEKEKAEKEKVAKEENQNSENRKETKQTTPVERKKRKDKSTDKSKETNEVGFVAKRGRRMSTRIANIKEAVSAGKKKDNEDSEHKEIKPMESEEVQDTEPAVNIPAVCIISQTVLKEAQIMMCPIDATTCEEDTAEEERMRREQMIELFGESFEEKDSNTADDVQQFEIFKRNLPLTEKVSEDQKMQNDNMEKESNLLDNTKEGTRITAENSNHALFNCDPAELPNTTWKTEESMGGDKPSASEIKKAHVKETKMVTSLVENAVNIGGKKDVNKVEKSADNQKKNNDDIITEKDTEQQSVAKDILLVGPGRSKRKRRCVMTMLE